MKSLLNALGVSVVLCTLILFSCTPNSGQQPVPIPEVKSDFKVMTPAPAWFDESVDISYTAENLDSLKIDGNKVDPSSGFFRLYNLKAETSVLFQAWGKKGFFSQTTVPVKVYSYVRKLLCTGSGVWVRTGNFIKHNGAWSPVTPVLCRAFVFYPNDSLRVVSTLCGDSTDRIGKYSLLKGDTQMLLAQFSNSDPWNIVTVTGKLLELVVERPNGDSIKDVYTR